MTCLFPCPQWHRAGQLDSAGWCSIAWQLFPASVACCDTLPLFHSPSQSRQNISWHGIWMHLAIWRIESSLDGKAHIRYHGQKGTAKLFLIVFAKAFGFPVVPVVPGIALVFTWDTAARCCQAISTVRHSAEAAAVSRIWPAIRRFAGCFVDFVDQRSAKIKIDQGMSIKDRLKRYAIDLLGTVRSHKMLDTFHKWSRKFKLSTVITTDSIRKPSELGIWHLSGPQANP